MFFKNYDVFKVFHWDWDLQNLVTQLNVAKSTINTTLKVTPGVDSLYVLSTLHCAIKEVLTLLDFCIMTPCLR